VQDDFAEWEREQITQRTAAGRREKARQGEVIAGRLADHGFRFGPDRESYEVAEEEKATVRRSSPSSPRVLRLTASVRPRTPTACPRRAVGRRSGSARSSGTAPSTTSTRHTPSKRSKPWPSPQGLQGARPSRALRRLVVQTSGSEDRARTLPPWGRSLPQGEADSQEAQARVDTSPRSRLGSTAKDRRTGAEAPRWGKLGAPPMLRCVSGNS
jgi:hypothetical protein